MGFPIHHGGQHFTLLAPFLHGEAVAIITDSAHISPKTTAFRGSCCSAIAGTRNRRYRTFLLRHAAYNISEFVLRISGRPYSVDLVSYHPIPITSHTRIKTFLKGLQHGALAKKFTQDNSWVNQLPQL